MNAPGPERRWLGAPARRSTRDGDCAARRRFVADPNLFNVLSDDAVRAAVEPSTDQP
jgi:hypothetical protein